MLTMTAPAMIRPVTLEDVPTIIGMFQAMRQETIWGQFNFPDEVQQYSVRLIYRLWTDEDFCLYVAEREEVVIGFCGGQVSRLYGLPYAKFVMEWGWYVLPEYRGGLVGGRLWNVVVEWGRSRGAIVAQRIKHLNESQELHTFVRL